MEENKMKCACPHHKIMPVLVVVFGMVFLLGSWNIFTDSAVSTLWPLIVIVAGFLKMGQGKCKCC